MEIERLANFTAAQLTAARSLDFVRYLSCLHERDGGDLLAAQRFSERFPRSLSVSLFTKAAVAAGTPESGWAAPLAAVKPLQSEFVALVRASALIGRIPGLRNVPFNVAVPVVTGGGQYGWVGSGKPKPVGQLALATAQLGIAKACGLLIVTSELIRLGAPGSEAVLRDDLVRGAAGYLDAQFIDPAVFATPNINPASITWAATPIASAGTSADNAKTDINALVRAFVAANPNVETAVIVLSPANAMALAATGSYKDLTLTGGFIAGVPAVVSAAAGSNLVMLDPGAVLTALDDITIDVAKSASVEMESAPAVPVAITVQVSLWQMNLVGLKVTAFANWKVARAGAVQYISGAAYV